MCAIVMGSKESDFEGNLLLDVLKNCCIIYALLGRIYEKEVETDFLEALSKRMALLKSQNIGDEELERGIRLLGSYLSAWKSRGFKNAEPELAVDYANLFLGVKGLPHPSESSYKCGFMMANPSEEVLKIYQKTNLNLKENYIEPADHIAVELYFMAHLCQKTAERIADNNMDEAKKCLQIMQNFLEKHLLSWIYAFTEDVLKSAETEFYKGVAVITKRFIELNRTLIKRVFKL
ncbi:MAG: molecular chaperone TorD family protein [Candidatus Bathyarchaeia archaeon]